MTTNNSKASKASEQKHNIKWRKLVKRFIARPLAYVALIVGSAYGYKRMLDALDGNVSTGLTVLLVLALVFIITDND